MKIITTDYRNKKFWEEKEADKQEISCMEAVIVYPEILRQDIKGFGGAFTESAAYCYSRLPKKRKGKFPGIIFWERWIKIQSGQNSPEQLRFCSF